MESFGKIFVVKLRFQQLLQISYLTWFEFSVYEKAGRLCFQNMRDYPLELALGEKIFLSNLFAFYEGRVGQRLSY